VFKLEGRDTGATFTLRPDMVAQGVPPHWGIYVAVAGADDAAAMVTQAGGKIIAAPFDVFDFGRMAVCQDPAGAVFMVWEAKAHQGTGITGVPGTLCWADLSVPNQDAVVPFYKDVFGWEFDPGKDGSGGYLHIKNGEKHIGGVPAAHQRNPQAPAHWMVYFQVDDCDASTAKAKELGAHFHMEPMTMEGVGRMSMMADPQGAVSFLFQPVRHQ
jgi:predicted enzyme related to lactoylglutathione lyase